VYKGFKKQQAHTALADVHESIDELVHYRTHFLRMEPDAVAAAVEKPADGTA
jgi:oligoribonuclease